MRNVGVADAVGHFHFLGQRPQARAQDDAGSRLEVIGVSLDVGGGFGQGLVQRLAELSGHAGNGAGKLLSAVALLLFYMKHLVLSLSLSCAASCAWAQQPGQPVHGPGPVLSVGLPTIAGALGVQVEQHLGRHFSVGVWGARFFSADFPGYQGGLLGRYYFRPTAPLGLYVQAQVGAFTHDAQRVSFYPGAIPVPYGSKLSGKGAGVGLGYQLALAKHFVANAALGLRIYNDPYRAQFYDSYYVGDFNAIGQPGSWLDGQLSVGYAF